MKTSFHESRIANHSQSGMAVIIVLAFLAIILIYLAANARTLHWLERDLKLIEQKQVQRLAGTNIKTNSIKALPNQSAPTNASKPQ
jgi:hypothetical protein